MREKLLMSDRLVFLAMCSLLSRSRLDRHAWPEVEDLTKMTMLSERSVYRSQARLQRLKLIQWVTDPELIPSGSGGRKLPTPPPGAWEIAVVAGTEMDEWKRIFLNTSEMKQFWAQKFVDGPRRLVLLAMLGHLNSKKDNQVWVSVTGLAKMTGLCRDTVRAALRELWVTGLIRPASGSKGRAPTNGQATVWDLVLPQDYSSLTAIEFPQTGGACGAPWSTDTDQYLTDTDQHPTDTDQHLTDTDRQSTDADRHKLKTLTKEGELKKEEPMKGRAAMRVWEDTPNFIPSSGETYNQRLQAEIMAGTWKPGKPQRYSPQFAPQCGPDKYDHDIALLRSVVEIPLEDEVYELVDDPIAVAEWERLTKDRARAGEGVAA